MTGFLPTLHMEDVSKANLLIELGSIINKFRYGL